jgi:conjugal transfer pilin signal peptidase TrbI
VVQSDLIAINIGLRLVMENLWVNYDHAQFKRRFGSLLLITWLIILALWWAGHYVQLAFNTTRSLDGWVYIVLKDTLPERGQVVAFHPPEGLNRSVGFLKQVWGLPGDLVSQTSRNFFINGQRVGFAKTHTLTGELLHPSTTGVIPERYYFVGTPHPDSLDSRYARMGWIAEDRFVGRAIRLF